MDIIVPFKKQLLQRIQNRDGLKFQTIQNFILDVTVLQLHSTASVTGTDKPWNYRKLLGIIYK
jgi:hypothetical protein